MGKSYVGKVEGLLRVNCPKGYNKVCMGKDYVLTDQALGQRKWATFLGVAQV